MQFDYERFFKTYNVDHWLFGKNVTSGWINVQCPFCDDHSNHLGFNPLDDIDMHSKDDQFKGTCWRCGGHSLYNYIKKHLNKTAPDIFKIFDDFSTGGLRRKRRIKEDRSGRTINMPGNDIVLRHKRYLRTRGLSPKELIESWDIKGTDHTEKLRGFKHRIMIPIYQDNALVTYQARDITGRAEIKYKNCSDEYEIISIKDCLYGIDYCDAGTCVVVEGVVDVWKLGKGAVCTFGTKFTKKQIARLCKMNTVYIYYDPEPEAQEKARELANSLISVPHVYIINGDKEPGDLSRKEGVEIMRELGMTY